MQCRFLNLLQSPHLEEQLEQVAIKNKTMNKKDKTHEHCEAPPLGFKKMRGQGIAGPQPLKVTA